MLVHATEARRGCESWGAQVSSGMAYVAQATSPLRTPYSVLRAPCSGSEQQTAMVSTKMGDASWYHARWRLGVGQAPASRECDHSHHHSTSTKYSVPAAINMPITWLLVRVMCPGHSITCYSTEYGILLLCSPPSVGAIRRRNDYAPSHSTHRRTLMRVYQAASLVALRQPDDTDPVTTRPTGKFSVMASAAAACTCVNRRVRSTRVLAEPVRSAWTSRQAPGGSAERAVHAPSPHDTTDAWRRTVPRVERRDAWARR